MSSLWTLVVLVGVVGVLTTAATALRTVSRIWLRHWAEQRLAGAGTATLFLERPQRLLIAAGAGIAATVYTLGAFLGLQLGDHGLSLAQAVLDDLLREGELEGVGAAEEREIISGVMEFGDRRVGQVMTPRADIVGLERSARADQVAHLVAQAKFTRLPVYDGTVDHIVGMVTSWDVIARPEAPLRAPRPVAIAAPDEACHALMTRMLREKRHLAIVRGAAGETLGLVTLEDLVEEFVGEIQDEHDDPVADR